MHGHCSTHFSQKYSRKMIGWFYLITCFSINRVSFSMLLLRIYWQVIFHHVIKDHFDPPKIVQKDHCDQFSNKNLSNILKTASILKFSPWSTDVNVGPIWFSIFLSSSKSDSSTSSYSRNKTINSKHPKRTRLETTCQKIWTSKWR